MRRPHDRQPRHIRSKPHRTGWRRPSPHRAAHHRPTLERLETRELLATIAFDMVDSSSHNLLSHTNAFENAFSSPGDGFQKYQRGVSPSIPFAVLDDSLASFTSDTLGIIDDNNLDQFFGVTDTENGDQTGPVSAVWQFDISSGGASPLTLSIDMGAMGDFESSEGVVDSFTWTYQIDGGAEQTAFAGVVDESGSVSYTLAGGFNSTLNDPMTVDGTTLSNRLTTLIASLNGTGSVLTLRLTAQTDGGSEAFAFQNIVIDAADPFAAFDMVGSSSQNLLSHTNAFENAFSSPGDGFQKYQRGVSPSIPFAVLDDSLASFTSDTLGIIDDNNLDQFFGVTDTENGDQTGPVSAVWQFDISGGGASPLTLSIDMGAMGDFESSPTPDVFTWTYQIDGGPVETAFRGDADESANQTYVLAGGLTTTLDDPLVVDGTRLSNVLQTFTTGINGTGSLLTLTLTAQTDGGSEAFAFQNIVIQPGSPPPPPASNPIYEIQGNGASSPLVGQSITTTGVVVADFQGSERLNGFFLQDPVGDGDASTSDGIFVFAPGAIDVQVGDVIQLTGTVAEFSGETQINAVTDLRVLAMNGAVPPTLVSLPVATADAFEPVEGMLVRFQQNLTVTETFDLGRFGEVSLSSGGRLFNPTQVAAPGADAIAAGLQNDLNRILLDDGSTLQNPDPVIHPTPELSALNSLRIGDSVAGLTGALGFRFGNYRVQPVTPPGVLFADANPRPFTPHDVGGSLKVASFNVLNYFTTLDQPGNTCGPLGEACRGADTPSELARQRDKLVNALATLNADVVGLVELENRFGQPDSAIADLVDGLNDALGAGTYAFVDPGMPFVGNQPIAVGLIYKPASVTPSGSPATLDTGAFDTTRNLNRVPLAQTFIENASGEGFTVVVNHFKSKGESGLTDANDPNFDQGDEQGFWNAIRTEAAAELASWLATDPTGSGDADVLILGDLNAYAMEDPLTALRDAGYTDLGRLYQGVEGQSSFVFFGESGSLDYILANPDLVGQVTGATTWRINSDEPRVLDYNEEFKSPTQQNTFYSPDPFRSSDHDPLIIGLSLGAEQPLPPAEGLVRLATFNASLNRNSTGQLVNDLSGQDPQARNIAEILQRVRPDVVLLNEFDFDNWGPDGGSAAADLFQQQYLSVSQNGADPIDYPFVFSAPSNTGVLSGFDLDNNGVTAQPADIGSGSYGNDSLGFGLFPGQFGMVLLSRFPILEDQVRTFQNFLWKDMPGALLPDDPTTAQPADWYAPQELDVFPLSSKSHWDVPLDVNGRTVHVLASHPTPPVFDGPEDRNGRRNHDEIRFWSDYITPGAGDYVYDDQGGTGGLAPGASFVILGDLNADPFDGDSTNEAVRQLLDNPHVNTRLTPASAGGPDAASRQGRANATHLADPAFDTADFNDASPGNLRADYVLPSQDLTIADAQVFWPTADHPLFRLAGDFDFSLIGQGFPTGFFSSDHRLVYVDVPSDTSRNTVTGLEFLGEVTFPTGSLFSGSEVGGLSGITYDASQQRYFSISDDRSEFDDARFFELTIDLGDGSLDDGDVVFTNFTTLLDENLLPYAPLAIDAEGIALTRDNSLWIVSERDLSGVPFIHQYSLDGELLGELPVPTSVLPGPGTGIRTNLAFESATLTPDQRYLITATENALVQDGPAADLGQESTARIIKYDLATGQPVAEYAYLVEEVPQTPNPPSGFRTNGLVELLAIDNNGTLLALERAFSAGVGNTVKLFEVLTQPAVEISGFAALDGLEPDPAVLKRELFDFADLGLTIDNLEGITFGPKLPDGRQSLIVVSDNNFNSVDQFTQFLAFAVQLTNLPAALPSVETPRVLDGFDPLPPTEKEGDADDPAIYVHPQDTSLSCVIGTLKDGGLQSYHLDGSVLQTIAPADIRYNNVDLIYGFPVAAPGGGHQPTDLAVVSDRENDTLAIFQIDPTTRQLTEITSPSIPATIFGVDDGEATAYGLATYVSPRDGSAYAFVTQADGNQVAQLRLFSDQPGLVSAEEVRRIHLPVPTGDAEDSVSEGLVVDQEWGYLYLSMEDADSGSPDDPAILKFEAEPDGGDTYTLVASLREPYLTADVEGLTLYYGADGKGYLLASSQGDSTFAVFAREGDNRYLGSFVVGSAQGIDSVEESDGLDVINVGLGTAFPHGLLVVHDGNEDPQAPVLDDEEIENGSKNFKFVPWEEVAYGFTPFLDLDASSYDPRNPQPPAGEMTIASGDTTQTSTVLWAQNYRSGELTFEVATDPEFNHIVWTGTERVSVNTLVPVKLTVEGLAPGTAYHYRVSENFLQSRVGRFRTAAPGSLHAGLRFGVSGDWRGELAPYPAVSNAVDADLEFFVGLGDTIYADYPSPDVPLDQAMTLDEFQRKHNEVYSERLGLNTLGDLRAVTSILATIDDHEVTNDFSGGAHPSSDPRFSGQPGDFIHETPLYENGLQAFQQFNPLADEFYGETGDNRTAGKRKLYRANSYGLDAATFVLDARSFRDDALPAVSDPNNPLQVGQFLAGSFNPSRTMLGQAQVDELKADLLAAEQAGVTWKFIMVPEPIQNLGVVGAGDRFEGYAAERTEILQFIHANEIDNVVFVAADIHGTVVNNLTYQTSPLGPQIPTSAFEVTTGSVAFDAPFGPTVADLAAALGLLTPQQRAFYDALPVAGKDQFIRQLIDQGLAPLGYDPVGLDNNLASANGQIDAQLLSGSYVSLHTYGWTQFEIDPESQRLTVTTYGIPPYTADDLASDPQGVLAREPAIMSQFQVLPQRDLGARLDGSTLVITGTNKSDRIRVTSHPRTNELIVSEGRTQIGRFDSDAVNRIVIYGYAGDDRLEIATSENKDSVLYGGEGNDLLRGSHGNDILLGGPGADYLLGWFGRDLLIGGSDADRIFGGGHDDLLIGGTTSYDQDPLLLDALLAHWTSLVPYGRRVDDLLSGNGVPALNASTIQDDSARDFLHGQQELDLFFAGARDFLADDRGNERTLRL